jgi:hypothetical protein
VLALCHGGKVIALLMGRLSFNTHIIACVLLNALTGFHPELGFKIKQLLNSSNCC